MRNTSFAFWCITGLVCSQRCNAKAEEQHPELHHTEEPHSDPAMGLETAKIKSERHGPWAAFFYPFLLHHPWNVWDKGRQAAFLGTTGMKKLEYPHCPWPWETARPLKRNEAAQEGSLRGWGRVQGQLGPARPHSCSLGTASLGGTWGMSCFLPKSALGGVKEMGGRLPRRVHMNSQLAAAARSIWSAHHSLEHEAVLQKWRQKPQKTKYKIQSHK